MRFVGPSTYDIQSGKYSSTGQIIFIGTIMVKRNSLAERIVVELRLAEGAHLRLDGSPLIIAAGARVTLRSSQSGATLDAANLSRALDVGSGAQLTPSARRLHRRCTPACQRLTKPHRPHRHACTDKVCRFIPLCAESIDSYS